MIKAQPIDTNVEMLDVSIKSYNVVYLLIFSICNSALKLDFQAWNYCTVISHVIILCETSEKVIDMKD